MNMKHLLTTAIIVLAVFNLSAQFDYQLFRPDVQYLYENYHLEAEEFRFYQSTIESPIIGMKTDERECQPLYKSFTTNACQPTPSFAGFEICQSPDFTIMYMGGSDYFRLETQASIGDSWTAGLIDTIVANGRVTQIDTMSFLGLIDTVKTISFFHPETDTLLGSPVIISKNYGLITCARFGKVNRFGFNEPLTLLGMSSPSVGLQNYTDEEVFAVEAGDVFHTFENYEGRQTRLAAEVTSVERDVEEIGHIKINYTGQKIIPTTIIRDGETIDTAILEDITSSWEYSRLIVEMLRRQPGEAYQSYEGIGSSYTVAQMFPANLCGLAGKRESVDMSFAFDRDCYFNSEAFDGTPSFFFYPGLGSDFGRISSATFGERILIYAKTSTLECGEPYDYEGIVTSLRATTEEIDFIAYPNPVVDELQVTINAPGRFNLYVMDQLGRRVISISEATTQTVISTENLAAGIYFLILESRSGVVGRKKLVIE